MITTILDYQDARKLIQEGDVLLFRAPPFPSIGWWITRYTGGIYSHVGIAHWDSDKLYCVEQREFKGGRSVVLSRQVTENQCRIDVFRAKPRIAIPHLEIREGERRIVYENKVLDFDTKRKITSTALELTGSPYGWRNIWRIFKGYAPFFRLVQEKGSSEEERHKVYVCSTLVGYSYRTNYVDPCPNLDDDRTSPDDIGRSALFDYLFTIGK